NAGGLSRGRPARPLALPLAGHGWLPGALLAGGWRCWRRVTGFSQEGFRMKELCRRLARSILLHAATLLHEPAEASRTRHASSTNAAKPPARGEPPPRT